jgi:hypothetical protein
MCEITPRKKDVKFSYVSKLFMLVCVVTLQDGRKRSVLIIQCQRKLIFSYVTLIAVQNKPLLSVYTFMHVSKGNYERVVFARGGSGREGGSVTVDNRANVDTEYFTQIEPYNNTLKIGTSYAEHPVQVYIHRPNPMLQNPSSEADSYCANKEISRIL